MAKKEFKSLSWLVAYYDCNANKITYYDVLKYREDFVKKLKKKCATKEEFAEKMRRECLRVYWSRCEYELIIEITEDERILLKPWAGCRDVERATIDVTNDTSFDWVGFAKQHIDKRYGNEEKIDIYSQLTYGDQFEKLVDLCWYTRLKYERADPKFNK